MKIMATLLIFAEKRQKLKREEKLAEGKGVVSSNRLLSDATASRRLFLYYRRRRGGRYEAAPSLAR